LGERDTKTQERGLRQRVKNPDTANDEDDKLMQEGEGASENVGTALNADAIQDKMDCLEGEMNQDGNMQVD